MTTQTAADLEALTTVAWLQERHDNCIRIAGSKVGSEKRGWLEDAAYFADAILLLSRLETDRKTAETAEARIRDLESREAVLVEALTEIRDSARRYAGDTGLYSEAPLWEEIEKADSILSSLPTAAASLRSRLETAERERDALAKDMDKVIAISVRNTNECDEQRTRAEKAESALSEARKSTRTPGTVEVCERYLSGNTCGAERGGREFEDCYHEKCPIKAASADMGREDGDG